MKWIIIISITQKEAFYLNNSGVPYGENGISVTHSNHSGKSYRLCESQNNLIMLKNYRKSRIVEK